MMAVAQAVASRVAAAQVTYRPAATRDADDDAPTPLGGATRRRLCRFVFAEGH